jgi:hypothetical protein
MLGGVALGVAATYEKQLGLSSLQRDALGIVATLFMILGAFLRCRALGSSDARASLYRKALSSASSPSFASCCPSFLSYSTIRPNHALELTTARSVFT